MQEETILVVDDELANLQKLHRTFVHRHPVLSANSGRDALEIIHQNKEIAVIIADQRMPDMTGVELLRQTLDVLPHAIRIILTGFIDVDVLIEAINSCKVYRYIVKPWDPPDLLMTVERGLEAYRLTEENERFRKELVRRERLARELEIAREIQVSLEPEQLPVFPWLSISFFSKPAKIVGGDFFNVVKRNGNQMLSIVGDVSGKGIPAALYAAHIQSMFESLSQQSTSPADILSGLNHLICKRLREGDFITAVIAFLESEKKSLTIARAGHNWPLYYCAQTGTIAPLKTKGVCLGVDQEKAFSSCLEERSMPLKSGDVLLLYSDGITEAMNAGRHLFDQSRLEAALKESAHFPADKIVERINLRLDEFIQSEELHDDVTMVAIKIK